MARAVHVGLERKRIVAYGQGRYSSLDVFVGTGNSIRRQGVVRSERGRPEHG